MNSMFPLTGIFCVLTQYVEIGIHKWIVLRRSKMQRKFGDSLILTCLNYTDMALLTYILGCMITYGLLIGYIPSIYWVNLIIAIIFNLLPLNLITRQLIEIPESQLDKKYWDYKEKFDYEAYQKFNPIGEIKVTELSDIS